MQAAGEILQWGRSLVDGADVGLLVAAGQLFDILKQPFFGLALAAWVARMKEGNSSHCPVSGARAGDAVVRVRSGMKMKSQEYFRHQY